MPAYDLNGKVALVTGGARGIGFETARQMHARGASVAVLDLDADEAREAAERIGERTLGIAGDVTDAGAMRAAVAEVVERFGGLDVAMANAGIAPPSIATMRSVPAEEWERVIDVNLLGVWHTVRAALPQVSERQGHIVVVASVAAFANGMLGSSYMVSKAAVEQLGRALRTELTPFGASASVAYFGWVDTRMVQETFSRPGAGTLEEIAPDFLMRRITPPQAGAAVVKGIEERAPRIFAPRWWRYLSALRGLLNPLLDRRSERDRRIAAAIRDAEERGAGEADAPAPTPSS
ncbi:MAG TPA: short-chain dehydrogenase/reductase [Solirubrobacterales bacterium]|nr:short-chain dehydrogenase/reductase [Solirubrobacterales bacterium]